MFDWLEGSPMPESGIYPNMSDADYFAVAALSNSRVKDFLKSPALFKYKITEETVQTPAMKFGRLYHAVLLQPQIIDSAYYIAEDTRGNTKAGKAAAAEAAMEGLELVKKEDYEKAVAMREAVLAHKKARFLLEHPASMFEVACFWQEDIDGVQVPCKCKLDIFNPELLGGIAADLKSTVDASPQRFPKTVADYGYHRQDAWYSRGPSQSGAGSVNAFAFIAQEKDPPYLTGLYTLNEGARQQGMYEMREALKQIIECAKTGNWYGYGEDFTEIDLPKWAQK